MQDNGLRSYIDAALMKAVRECGKLARWVNEYAMTMGEARGATKSYVCYELMFWRMREYTALSW